MTFANILLASLILLAGCVSKPTPPTVPPVPPPPPTVEQIKRDLIGHTMGGREKSWYFSSVDQIESIRILKHTTHTTTIELILKSSTGKRFLARALLMYRLNKLMYVGELYIEQLN